MNVLPTDLANLSREEKLALLARLAKEGGRDAAVKLPDTGVFPLSFAQQRFWFLDQLEPGSFLDNMFRSLRLTGPLDRAALERSLAELVRRHPSLRTRFPEEGGEPRQVVEAELPGGFRLEIVEAPESARAVGGESSLAWAVAYAGEESRRTFDLAQGPLFRAKLLGLAGEDHVLLLTLHHIISDGWSNGLLLRELSVVYTALVAGQPSPLAEPRARYSDFARAQREKLAGDALVQELAFWRERLEGMPAVLELPTDHPRRQTASPRGDAVTFEILDPAAAECKALAQTAGATPFMALLALFDVLLFRYTEQGDFAVGIPVANRTRTEYEGVVGCFASTLLVRSRVRRAVSFREMLGEVRSEALAVFGHADLPFEKLVDELQPDRNLSHNPLFQVVFALQNTGGGGRMTMAGLELSSLPIDRGLAKIDLTLEMFERPGGLGGYLEYSTDLFEAATVQRMARHFQTLFASALAEPDRGVGDLPILAQEERDEILVGWNQLANDPPRLLLGDLVAAARRTPEAVAVLFGDEQMTHGELHAQANRLARYLRRLGVGPEMSVGLCVERSLEMPLALLAVLKAGGAWVPLDPEYPKERLALMIEDTAMPVLLTQKHLADRLPETFGHTLISIDTLDLSGEDDSEPDWEIHPESLAYIVYTSGSTGRPKGVAVPHRSWANHVYACAQRYRMGPRDRTLQFTSISFDITSEEIFPTWLMGGGVVPRPPGLFPSFDELQSLIVRYEITAMDLPTAYWHEWVGEMYRAKTPPPEPLRLVVIGTEQALPERVAEWLELCGDRVKLNNSYASTEATVTAVVYEPSLADLPRYRAGDRVPVGKTIPNCCAYVLDSGLQPVPPGVPGDVYIAGPNVSRGYANWPDRTAASFVPDPFAASLGYGEGQRMYRQGDIGRWLASGDLEYLGRRDDQVKIRGFRVEPDEVGTVLARHPAVKDCAVLVKSDGPKGKRLVGYLTLVSGQAATVRELREFLRESLPEHMVPSALVILESLPLTSNGRVDARVLPEPTEERPELEGAYVAPQTATEEILEGIWCEVLGVARVGVHDNFFELGGHSLLGTQVVSRARERFHIELPLRALFDNPTVASLARKVEELRRAAVTGAAPPRIEPVPRTGELALSFSQQRLWFLDRLEPGSATYNIPLALHLQGSLDTAALAAAFYGVVERHEALRTTFGESEGNPYQIVHSIASPVASPPEVALPLLDLSGFDLEQRSSEARRLMGEEARRPFALDRGPLIRANLFRLGAEEHLLTVTMHHIVSDGWSLPLFIGELDALYRERTGGPVAALPPLPIQYADFAHWQRQWLQGEVLAAELAHWRGKLAGLPSLIELPTDRPRPAIRSWAGDARRTPLKVEIAEGLRDVGRRLGATPFMIVLAAYASLLHRYSRQECVAVGVPVAGRGRVEIERLIGFFVNTLVLRCDVRGDLAARALVEQVRETVLDADAHQDVPFEKLVEELAPERSMSHTPLFQVALAFQNLPKADFAAEGLRVTPVGVSSGTAKFDLMLAFQADDERPSLYLEYSTELFDAATIDRFGGHFSRLLESLVALPEQRVADLPLLSDEERLQIEGWNATAASYPVETRLHEQIAAQAGRTPDAPAVRAEDGALTYGQLERAAHRLALRLVADGVGTESVVGVLAERSLEMVVALLAVLKAGGAYLPLDPDYPADRLAFMLADSKVPVVLGQAHLLARLPQHGARVLPLEGTADGGEGESLAALPAGAGAGSLAYVIYTSGSTGRPKGTMNSHRGILNRLHWMQEAYGLTPADRVLQKTPYSFDVSVWEFFWPLLIGAELVMARPGGHQEPDYLVRTIQAERITTMHFVPSMLRVFLEADGVEGCAASLKRVMCSGEALPHELERRFYARLSQVDLHNLYGPTEAAVDVTYWACEREDRRGLVPIGWPVANTQIHIVDAEARPQPIGVAGELLIGGVQVGRGYLARPDLTAERFVPDPLSTEPGARVYRTGDLARRLADGAIDFLGRIDHQVKLRGLRIELGEIEAALARHPGVAQAVVVVREDVPGSQHLAAYWVPAPGAAPAQNDLRAALKADLPEYMIPTWFMALDAMPLTASGKVDRKALPVPEGGGAVAEFVPPVGETQERLATLWAEILRRERVGANDNFFELGGHSLMATQVLSRVQKTFGVELPLRVIFDRPTIAGLEEAILEKTLERTDDDLLAQLLSELEAEPA